jgi:hypothetical protein
MKSHETEQDISSLLVITSSGRTGGTFFFFPVSILGPKAL